MMPGKSALSRILAEGDHTIYPESRASQISALCDNLARVGIPKKTFLCLKRIYLKPDLRTTSNYSKHA